VYKILAFIGLSVGLIYLSRNSLRAPRSHGFFRFFAWESITALFLLNIDVWFLAPWSWNQVISWILLFGSVVPLVLGIRTLTAKGKPNKQREGEPQLLDFEKTSALVTTGIYHYIRHPLYSSLLFLAWGVFFKTPSGAGGSLALTATLFLFFTARADESECIRFFGPIYRDYMKRTRMFVPFML